jgi:outer membrane protein assembly factor BamB
MPCSFDIDNLTGLVEGVTGRASEIFWPALAVIMESALMKAKGLLSVMLLTWLSLTLVVSGTARAADGGLKWKYQTGGVLSSPAIGADGTIYVGSYDNYLYAISPPISGTAGILKWKFETEYHIDCSPAVGKDGTIYVGSNDNFLYALDPNPPGITGSLKWRYKTGNSVNSSPAIGPDGTIYVGSLDGYLYALDPKPSTANGSRKWRYYVGSAISTESSPVVGKDGTIYIVGLDGIHAVDRNGNFKWKYSPDEGSELRSTPAIGADGTIYFGSGSNDKYLYALDPNPNTSAGLLKWEYVLPAGWFATSFSPAIGADGTIYIGASDLDGKGALYAITPPTPVSTTAVLKWRYQTEKQIYSSPAIGADGVIYVGSYDNYLYALDPNPGSPDGHMKWRYNTELPVASSPAIGPDSTVYVGSNDTLHAIVSSGGGLGKTPWPMFHLDVRHTGNLAKIANPGLSLLLLLE